MSDRLKSAIRRVAWRMGYEIHRHSPTTREEMRLARLLANQRVSVVLDVGANVGQYGEGLRRGGYGERIVSFEPSSAAFVELSSRAEGDPQWECRRLALGASEGVTEINLSADSVSSSLLGIKERYVATRPSAAFIETETVSLTTLDSIWNQVVRPEDHPYLKLDVQGFEMEVLRGAAASLADVIGVQTELSLVPLYQGAPSYREVIDYLESHGFRLTGVESVFEDPETGEMLQIDGIFIRR